MAGTTKSFRISDETSEKLQAAKGNFDGNADEFIAQLLLDHELAQQAGIEAPSRARPEILTLSKMFQDALDRMNAIATLAEGERAAAAADIEKIRAETSVQLAEMREKLSLASDQLQVNEIDMGVKDAELAQALKALETAQGQVESVTELKRAWKDKETALNARMAELNQVANEARQIREELTVVTKAKEVVERDLADATRKAQDLAGRVDALEAELQFREADRDRLARELATSREAQVRSQAQVEALTARGQEQAQALQEAKTEAKALVAQLTDLAKHQLVREPLQEPGKKGGEK